MRRECLPDLVRHGLGDAGPCKPGKPRGGPLNVGHATDLVREVWRGAVPSAVVTEDAGASGCTNKGGEAHPLGLLLRGGWHLHVGVRAWDLADGAVLPGGVDHEEVDGAGGRQVLGDVPHLVEGQLLGPFAPEVHPHPLRVPHTALQRLATEGALTQGVAVAVQVLVLNGSGQAEVAPGTADRIIRGAKDLCDDGSDCGQVHHGGPDRVVQHMPGSRSRAEAVAVREPTALGDVLAAIWPGVGQNLPKNPRTRATPPLQLLGVEAVLHHHKAVSVEDLGCAVDLMRLADLQPFDAIVVAQVLPQRLYGWIIWVPLTGQPGRLVHLAEAARLWRRQLAFTIHGLVGLNRHVPAHLRWAEDLQVL
mmetsp:Transcript_59127/g.163549  ORF Transcript_59127/g.163549 Transcript_59127/m.163549 type:complete len:363 (-) Transcript_59127:186-1274(-)